MPNRVTVLLDQQDAPLIVQGDDRHRAGVIDVLSDDLTVSVAHTVGADVPDPAAVYEIAVKDLRFERLVAEVLRRLSHPR